MNAVGDSIDDYFAQDHPACVALTRRRSASAFDAGVGARPDAR